MRIANCYRGVFCLGHIKRHGIDDSYLQKFENARQNHKTQIYGDLVQSGNIVDTIFSTYDLSPEYKNLVIEEFNPSLLIFNDKEMINMDTWKAQLLHYEELLIGISKIENDFNFRYDLIMVGRTDTHFHRQVSSLPIDLEKFNIIFQHPSGNCDDNFWIFPRSYLDTFEQAVNHLIRCTKITHEMNHAIIQMGGQVHYMYEHKEVPSNIGHDVFDFVR